MKKRLISLLLAFSMMLTFLPAGAVPAFAEENIGRRIENGEIISQGGTYSLSGNYTKAIKITTSDLVTINIADGEEVTFSPSNYPITMLRVEEGGNLIVNNHGSYKGTTFLSFAGTTAKISGGNYETTLGRYNSNMGMAAFSFDEGEDVTIENAKIQAGDYCVGVKACYYTPKKSVNIHIVNSEIKQMGPYYPDSAAIAHYKSSNVTLDGVTIETRACPAILAEGNSLIINSGKYTSASIRIVHSKETEKTVINGGEFEVEGPSYSVVSNSGPMEIHGGKFTAGSNGEVLICSGNIVIDDEKSTPEFYSTSGRFDAIKFQGSYSENPLMTFKAGIIHISGGGQRAAIAIGTDYTGYQGTAIIDSARVKIEGGRRYGIRVRDHVTAILNDITLNEVGTGIYLERDQKIEIANTYTGNVEIMCADPSDGRQLTTATTGTDYQKNLNLTSASVYYLVGYKKTADGKEYRCLSKTVGVNVNGLEGALKAEDPAEFTVTLSHAGSTGIGILTFGSKNGEIEYQDETGAYQPMQESGLPIDLGAARDQYTFRITPQNAGDQTLTAAVERDAVELGTKSKGYHVAGRVRTAVTIEGLEDAVITGGESKDFTVKVVPNDDAHLGEAVIDFGDKNGEIEYKDGNGEYQPMPGGGLPIDLRDGEKPYAFRITPQTPGQQTLTAVVKQGETVLASNTTNLTGTKTLSVTGGNVTVEKDGRILNIVPVVSGDKKTYSIPEDNVKVTVTLDKTQIPEGMVFDIWTTGSFLLPSDQNYKAETITFTMNENVDIAAQYRDATIEDDGSTVLGTAAIIGTAVVGTMVLGYQAYSLGTEFAGYLMDLPYFPANRSALAVMLWEDAGKPMPESERLYSDIGQEEQDMDLQYAARWAMENDLIPDRNEEGTAPEEMKFYPGNAVSRIDVLKAWQKAQELKKNA